MKMKSRIIKLLKSLSIYYIVFDFYCMIFPIRGKNNVIVRQGGRNKSKIHINGNGNRLEFGKDVLINKIDIVIIGDNNRIVIGDGVHIYNRKPADYFLCEGNNCLMYIGNDTSIQSAHINVQEDNSEIHIGEGCLFSDDIIVRTSDSHPIYDEQGVRINPAKSVFIGNHVWVSQHCTILKGAIIGEGSVIGSGSIVTNDVPEHSIAVGVPAKTVRQGINWSRL